MITTRIHYLMQGNIAIVMLLSLVFSFACNDKPDETFTPQVDLSQTSFDFTHEGGSIVLTITTNTSLELQGPEADWYSISGADANDAGTQVFVINTTPNTSTESRQVQLTLLGRQYARYLQINQAGYHNDSDSDEALAITRTLGMGWNLGNQLDAYTDGVANETAWGNAATTQQAFDKIAAAGIASVRIPVTWLGKVGPAPDYTINADWLNRVARVVDYAENAGLNAIINIHHDGADSKYWLNIKDAATNQQVNQAVKDQLAAMWTQIAEKFKNKGHFLIFESMNEVHDGGWGWGANLKDDGQQYAVLNQWNQVFVDAVRSTGGNNSNRFLGIPGYVTNPQLTIDHLQLPTDPASNRLLVSVHYYDPHTFTLEDEYKEWGHTASAGKKADYGDETHVREVFGKLKAEFIDNGIAVYIGEMGCVHRNTDHAEDFRKYYLEYVCKAARTYGLAPFYWDNGSADAGRESSGVINHANGSFINNGEDIVSLMVNAVTNNDPTYSLDSVYNKAP